MNDENLEEYNKHAKTIVVPDIKLSSANQNYKESMYKGCQFVATNFQMLIPYVKLF